MSGESEKTIAWVILMVVGAVFLSVLVAVFVTAVGALSYFLTHGGAALLFLTVVYLLWRSRR